MNERNVLRIAQIAHNINAAYCRSAGDHSQPEWHTAPDWLKDSAVSGVKAHIRTPSMTPEQSHEAWLLQKQLDGWLYGPVKDPVKKFHPCCVPYSLLPVAQRAKDYLFREVVHSMVQFIETEAINGKEKEKKENTQAEGQRQS